MDFWKLFFLPGSEIEGARMRRQIRRHQRQEYARKQNTPGTGGAGAGGAGGTGAGAGNDTTQGGGGDDPEPPADPYKADRERAIRDRDKAKKKLAGTVASVAALLGVEESQIHIVPNPAAKDDEDAPPYILECDGIDDLADHIKAARDHAAGNKPPKKKGADDTDQKYRAQLTRLNSERERERGAYTRVIENLAVNAEIRQACAAEGILEGAFDQVATLVSPRLGRKVEYDDEAGTVDVEITTLNDDKTPFLNKGGKPGTIRDLVADFAAKNPHFKKNGVSRGPGAGQTGAPGGVIAGQGDHKQAARSAAATMFGRRLQATGNGQQ